MRFDKILNSGKNVLNTNFNLRINEDYLINSFYAKKIITKFPCGFYVYFMGLCWCFLNFLNVYKALI